MSFLSISDNTIRELLSTERTILMQQASLITEQSSVVLPANNNELAEWLKQLWPDVWGPDTG